MISLSPPKTGKDLKKLVLWLVLSFTALLALRYNYELCTGLTDCGRLVSLLSAIPLAFSINNDTDFLICAAVFMLYALADSIGISEKRGAGILALVFSLLHTLANTSATDFGWRLIGANALQLCLSILCAAGYAALYYPIIRLIFTAMEKCRGRVLRLKHPIRTGALIMLLCWLPWLLLTYPGSFCPDALYQLEMSQGIVPYSAHKPAIKLGDNGALLFCRQAAWQRKFRLLFISFASNRTRLNYFFLQPFSASALRRASGAVGGRACVLLCFAHLVLLNTVV